MQIVLPNNWKPRSYQLPLWKALESGVKRSLCVWHRRSGKDLTLLNYIACASQKRVGTYWHVAPTYKQGRAIVWNGMRGDGVRFLDAFPGWRNPGPAKKGHFVTRVRDDEMTLWLANGSQFSVVGADDVDRLVGPNPIGVAMTEYAIQDPMFWEFVRPMLMENNGWASMIYTPRSKNHGWKMWEIARKSDRWFSQMLTVEDTARISEEAGEPIPVTQEIIELEKADGMSDELVAQEFFCSFESPVEGAYYGAQMRQLREDKRIRKVPWDPELLVHTAWDIGRADSTAIVFVQTHGFETRIIDYYENSLVGMEHYAKILKEKPYTYGDHYAPHDIKVHDYSSQGGRARYEIARDLGIRFRIVRKLSPADGIQAVRALLPKCWFDEDKAERLVDALNQYHRVKLPNGEFADYHHKDWTNHPADAMRYLAVGLRTEKKSTTTPSRKKQRERLAYIV